MQCIHDDINVDMWTACIADALQRVRDGGQRSCENAVLDGTSEPDRRGHRFYLRAPLLPTVSQAVQHALPGCAIFSGQCSVLEAERHARVQRPRTWILVTPEMQRAVERLRALQRWLRRWRTQLYICALVVCMCALVWAAWGLHAHWRGYREPWRNLLALTTQAARALW